MATGRYRVQYAHYDGNVYDVAAFDDLAQAQVRAETQRRRLGFVLPVFVTDDDNPERGDVSDADPDDLRW